MKSEPVKVSHAVAAGPRMRGGAFHRHLVEQVCVDLLDAGFETLLEHPCQLPNGRLDFVDILAIRKGIHLACEIETTPRYAAINIAKARLLGLPLFVVASNRKVRGSIRRRCAQQLDDAGCEPIWILLPDEVEQALRACFPGFSSGEWGNGNTGIWKNNSHQTG